MLLLTNNKAEHIPSPREQIPKQPIIELSRDTHACQPWQKALVIPPAI